MSVSPHMNTAHPRSLARRLWLGSSLLGVAAGAYPAWQASRGDILEVLRNAE